MAGYENKRARTRAALLDAGMAAVAERGVSALAIGEVASRAGVVAGTFYNYFPTRDAFVGALADHLASDVNLGIEQVRALEGDPAGRVALAILGLVRRARADHQFGAAFAHFVARVPSFAAHLRGLTTTAVVEGAERGRFEVPEGDEAIDALIGVTVEAVRAAAAGRGGPDAPERFATLALQLLGMSPGSAAGVVAAARQGGRPERTG